jgi:hypothetical protein
MNRQAADAGQAERHLDVSRQGGFVDLAVRKERRVEGGEVAAQIQPHPGARVADHVLGHASSRRREKLFIGHRSSSWNGGLS